MSASGERRDRLSIDVEPEWHRRIKIAAATRDLSVREYVEAILRQALDAETQATSSTLSARSLAQDAEQDETSNRPLTHAEQERGLQALEKLERLDRELLN